MAENHFGAHERENGAPFARAAAALRPRWVHGSVNRPGNNTITYTEARQMYSVSRGMAHEYSEVSSYFFQPTDDWVEIVKTYAKISLDPTKVYEVSTKIVIEYPIYVIGNGAKIRFTSGDAGFFIRTKKDSVPMFDFDENVFLGCVFERGCEEPNVCIESNPTIILQSCVFLNMYGVCFKPNASCTLRGCHFVASRCGIKTSNGFSRITLKGCTFEKCLVGMQTSGLEVYMYDTVFNDNLCAVFAKQHLTCRNCTFIVNDRQSVPFTCDRLCDCTSGHSLPLANVHVAKAKNLPFPVFTHCSFIRCRVYLGARNNVFHPEGCNILHSTLLFDNASARVVCLTGLFMDTARVKKLLRRKSEKKELRWCLCGERHECPIPLSNDITSLMRVNREVHSVDSTEFMFSDSE